MILPFIGVKLKCAFDFLLSTLPIPIPLQKDDSHPAVSSAKRRVEFQGFGECRTSSWYVLSATIISSCKDERVREKCISRCKIWIQLNSLFKILGCGSAGGLGHTIQISTPFEIGFIRCRIDRSSHRQLRLLGRHETQPDLLCDITRDFALKRKDVTHFAGVLRAP